MADIQHIVFPIDFSAHCIQAAPYVRELANHTGARITMLHVVQLPAFWFGGGALTHVGSYVDLAGIMEHRQKDLNHFLKEDLGALRVSRILAQGDAAGIITDFASRERADLIMMPTRGHGLFRRFLLGSVAAKVLHDSPCPVWTSVHRNEAEPPQHVSYRTVLCAVDLSPKSVPLLHWAMKFACDQGATLRVAHVEPAVEEQSQNRGCIEIQRYLYSQAKERWRAIQQELGTETDLLLAGGPVGAAVSRVAISCNVDLVIIGRGHLQEPFGGLRTEAYGIIREAPCPVLSK